MPVFVMSYDTVDDYDIKVLQSPNEIEAVKEVLEPFQKHPNADIELYLSKFSDAGDEVGPCVLVVSHNGQAQGVLLGMLHSVALDLRVGYKVVLSPRVRMMSIASGAVQGELEGAAAEALMDELLALLRRGEADAIRFFDLDEDSDLAKLAKQRPGLLCRDHAPWSIRHYAMTVPESSDKFFRQMKEKHRRPLRKACRLIEQDNPKEMSYGIFSRSDEVDQFAHDAELVAQRTYQRHQGASFVDSPAMRRWLRILAERGQWRGHILFVRAQPCAYWLGWFYGDTFYVSYAGHDPAFRDFNPGTGTILFAKMIEDVCENTDARVADFGPGDYAYKRRFCDISKQTVTLLIFAPTGFGVSVNILRTVLSWTGKSASALLGRLGLRERVKRYWRNRLGGKGTG